MKAKLANRFVFQVTREVHYKIQSFFVDTAKNGGIPYTDEQLFYIKLGAESAMADLATIVGANNSKPVTCNKWHIYSQRS